VTEQFIQERKYLKAVSPKTIVWYHCSFKAFAGAMESNAAVNQSIVELRESLAYHYQQLPTGAWLVPGGPCRACF